MFTIAFKYILKRLLVTFFIVSPIVIFVAWLAVSGKYIGMIVSDGMPFVTFMKMIFCISPGICGMILPICFLLASIITLQTLQTNKEILALMNAGKSPISILSPVLLLGCLTSVVVLFINTIGAPYAYKTFEQQKEQVQTNILKNFLKVRSFNNIGNFVVYIGSRRENAINNIFISYVPKNQNSNTNIIVAKRGDLVNENNKMFIHLENGCRQELDKNNDVVAISTFETLTYDVTHFFNRFYEKSSKVKYKTQTELLRNIRETSDDLHKTNCLVEYHSRLLTPFISIMEAIIVGIFLLGAQSRVKRYRDAIFAFICGIICHVGVMILINSSKIVTYNYIILSLFTLAQILTFLKKRN